MKRFRFESFMRFIIQSPKYGTFTEAARTDPEKYSHDNLILIILGEMNLSIWNLYNKFFGTTTSLGVCSEICRQRKRISVTELFKRLHRKRIEQSRLDT